jgi:hypothetical protein
VGAAGGAGSEGAVNPDWTDMSDPAEEPDDWQQAWDQMAEILGDEEPMPPQTPDRPDHPDRWREFDTQAAWEAWEWVRTAPQVLRKEATR